MSNLDGQTFHCCACPGCDCLGRETAKHKCGLAQDCPACNGDDLLDHTCGLPVLKVRTAEQAKPGPLPQEAEDVLEGLLTMVHAFHDLERKAGVRFLYNSFRAMLTALQAGREAVK